MVVTTWAIYMTLSGKWPILLEFWPASATMIFGSFVAGSTPAGGGAVAFPVFTKILHVATETSRTHALMIQSVGMTMASIFIFTHKIPIYRRVVKWACLGGAIGITTGALFLRLPDPFPKVLFTAVILAFGINFAFCHGVLKLRPTAELPSNWGLRNRIHFILAGLAGGLISSATGSGIDLVCFILMTLGYGLYERRSICTSVIIMAFISILGFLIHGLILHDTEPAFDYWLASVPIVAVGAPLGSLAAFLIPQRPLITGIFLLVILETVTTLLLVMPHAPSPVWLAGAATLFTTALWFWLMLRRRHQLEKQPLPLIPTK